MKAWNDNDTVRPGRLQEDSEAEEEAEEEDLEDAERAADARLDHVDTMEEDEVRVLAPLSPRSETLLGPSAPPVPDCVMLRAPRPWSRTRWDCCAFCVSSNAGQY